MSDKDLIVILGEIKSGLDDMTDLYFSAYGEVLSLTSGQLQYKNRYIDFHSEWTRMMTDKYSEHDDLYIDAYILRSSVRQVVKELEAVVKNADVDPEHKKRLDYLGNLHTVKNAKYGKSFDRGLDKHGVISWIVRDEDKENRMLQLFDQCIKKDLETGEWFFDGTSLEGNDESLSDTILDRANYLIMLDMWIKQLPAKRYSDIYADNKVVDTISILEERDTDDSKDRVDYEAHARKKFLTNSIYNKTLLESREEGSKKHISQEEWDKKLYLGWSEYDLEKIYSVFISDEQYEKENKEEWDTYDKDK